MIFSSNLFITPSSQSDIRLVRLSSKTSPRALFELL
nr:MAG TPA: hypothetical protein [Caudoviricetes sp.]